MGARDDHFAAALEVEAGAHVLETQPSSTFSRFEHWLARSRDAGITVPVLADGLRGGQSARH